ncbi:MAG: DUF4097 family beta strand repeat protein [Firmicutes bacterium]|nr:DUF4097 family beta strand repeat protein [Bacillota bacterium]
MDEERMMILRMVEQGKITASEAEKLLLALESSKSFPKGGFGIHSAQELVQRLSQEADRVGEVLGRSAEKFAGHAEKLAERAGQIAERVESAAHWPKHRAMHRHGRSWPVNVDLRSLGDITGWIKNLSLFGEGSGRRFEFEEVIEESFSEDTSVVGVECSVTNGSIELESWTEPHLRVVASKRLRGETREEAEESARNLLLVERRSDGLTLRSQEGRDKRVSLKIFVPERHVYDLLLRSQNGRVAAKGPRCSRCELTTANGSAKVADLAASAVKIESSNGSVRAEQVEAAGLEARTSNGAIHVVTPGGKVRCTTSNGSIDLVVPPAGGNRAVMAPEPLGGQAAPDGEAGKQGVCEEDRFELETSNGSIRITLDPSRIGHSLVEAGSSLGRVDIELPGATFQVNERRFGKNRVVAQGEEFQQAGRPLRILARTSNGSISARAEGSQKEGSGDEWEKKQFAS